VTALDFMFMCLGSGALLVCSAWTYKVINDVRVRSNIEKHIASTSSKRLDEPLDPMNRQLAELRNASFGTQQRSTRVPTETWPRYRQPLPRSKQPSEQQQTGIAKNVDDSKKTKGK